MSRSSAESAHGFLVIDKPKSWTSFDVVAKLRTITSQRAIGHAGTLDPFATGVLVCAFGRALKVLEYVSGQDKVYRGRVRLGQNSDTDDLEGTKTDVAVNMPPVAPQVRLVLEKFVGSIMQVPPKYSALRVQGRRMYELARAGKSFVRPARPVKIHALKLLAYRYPHLDLECRVSSGTYIRALARDIGAELGTGGFLEELIRLRVGSFTLGDTKTLDDVQHQPLPKLLLPLESATADLPSVALSQNDVRRLAHGQTIRAAPALNKFSAVQDLAVMTDHLLMIVRFNPTTNLLKSYKIIDESLFTR